MNERIYYNEEMLIENVYINDGVLIIRLLMNDGSILESKWLKFEIDTYIYYRNRIGEYVQINIDQPISGYAE